MEKRLRIYNVIGAIVVFVGIPVLLYTLGEYPRRSILKETISLMTILAFSLMLLQFFLARSNNYLLKVHKMASVVKVHKFIGYFFITILLVHPFLIVLPRFFESGVDPKDAFLTLITSFDRSGVILGMLAYATMLLIGLTSFFRKKLPITYKTWRIFHGILSVIFIGLASWHVLSMGRHINLAITVYILVLSILGVQLLLNTYFSNSSKKAGGK
ncbi:MAG: ferric reductase-like transmembrane domain-containing protein [Prolixibacteraceae bacterium]